MNALAGRSASVVRKTSETEIELTLGLDGNGQHQIHTGIGFFDHMLSLFAKHGQFDLNVKVNGDLHIDDHHTIEDVGIVLGTAFHEALGDKSHINRYGHAYVPMDEALARCVVDLSGRFFLQMQAGFSRDTVGGMATEMVSHFWYSVAEKAACNLHLDLLKGTNTHHQVEALFKAAAYAFRMAVQRKPGNPEIPSTKGVI